MADANESKTSKLDRRKFLTGLAVGAGLAPLAGGIMRPVTAGRAAQSGSLCYAPQGPLLTAQDISYLGYYDMLTRGNDTGFAQGLTHRYINGDLRLLTYHLNGQLHEVSLSGQTYGNVISSPTNTWSFGGLLDFKGIWWEESMQRLWTVSAQDYTNSFIQVQLMTRSLNSNGTVSNVRGPVGLSGISAKRVYGGVQPIPAWFRSRYGVGPYACGWGGYTSLVAQGGGASLGPTAYAFPEPSSYADNTDIPVGSYKTMTDHLSGTLNGDWYKSGSLPTSFDRGVRLTNPVNYFDGGDARQNPPSRPTVSPLTTAQWLSPAPDGKGRFTWGDSYYGTGVWIDGPNKQGFLMIASLGGGSCWYESSTLHFDSRVFECHVFDPTHFGEVIEGRRAAWNVQPSSMQQLNLPGLGSVGLSNNVPYGNVGGATYDPATKRLYLMGLGANTYAARLYVYSVNA